MKLTLTLIFILIFPKLLFSTETLKPAKANTVYGGLKIKEDSTLKKLLVLPEIATQYENCKKSLNNKLEEIPNCLWNGDNKKIKPLNQSQKDEVKKIYAEEESKSKTKENVNSDKTTTFTNRSDYIVTDYASDPSVKALSAFFGKKLDEVLNGSAQEKKDKVILTVDHKKFINLYTSEIGKSIVNAFTSYCMETDPICRDGSNSKPCLIPADDKATNNKKRKDFIAENLKTINNADFSTAEGEKWTYCIGTVSEVCYNQNATSETDDVKYSRQRACLIMDFVKVARKNLIASEEQKKFYDGLIDGGGMATHMKIVNDKDSSADKLSQITSSDIDSNLKSSNTKIENEINNCLGPNGQSVTKDKCNQFIDTNTIKNTNAVTEFGLRQFAKEETLNEKLSDPKNVGSYLKEEGYSDEQIKKLTSSENIEEVKDKIKKRFAEEKKAIIGEMSARMSSKTSATDGAIDQSDTSALGKIKTDLASRNDDLKNLIHFNNIVASYLNIAEGEGTNKKLSRNTASLFAEVNSMDKKESAPLMERIKKNNDLKDNQTTADFQINDINQILKYKKDK